MDLDKSSPTVRLNIPGKSIDEIPMPSSSLVPAGSRNFSRYALFVPGIARVLFQNDTSANGHRGRENNYMIDGTDNNDQSRHVAGAPGSTGGYPGNGCSGINIFRRVRQKPRRPDQCHYQERHQHATTDSCGSSIAATRWNLSRLQISEQVLRRSPRLVDHQFGGTFGGPIIRNKTFVFGMVQGNLLRTGPRASSTATIPTPAGYAALQTAPLRSGQSQRESRAVLQYLSFLPDVHSGVNRLHSLFNAIGQRNTGGDGDVQFGDSDASEHLVRLR